MPDERPAGRLCLETVAQVDRERASVHLSVGGEVEWGRGREGSPGHEPTRLVGAIDADRPDEPARLRLILIAIDVESDAQTLGRAVLGQLLEEARRPRAGPIDRLEHALVKRARGGVEPGFGAATEPEVGERGDGEAAAESEPAPGFAEHDLEAPELRDILLLGVEVDDLGRGLGGRLVDRRPDDRVARGVGATCPVTVVYGVDHTADEIPGRVATGVPPAVRGLVRLGELVAVLEGRGVEVLRVVIHGRRPCQELSGED